MGATKRGSARPLPADRAGATRPGSASGYSGTPLSQKLGLKAGSLVAIIGAPAHYKQLVTPLPSGIRFASGETPNADITHLFRKQERALAISVRSLRAAMRDDAVLWVSWPKKSSGVATDITEDAIRAIALPLGLVDVKVCAIDEVWSALKLVVRRELRASTKSSPSSR